MFWITFYVFASCAFVLPMLYGISVLFRRLRVAPGWQLALYGAVSVMPLVPYAVVAAQTAVYQESDCGSAHGNMFPPYPEAREF